MPFRPPPAAQGRGALGGRGGLPLRKRRGELPPGPRAGGGGRGPGSPTCVPQASQGASTVLHAGVLLAFLTPVPEVFLLPAPRPARPPRLGSPLRGSSSLLPRPCPQKAVGWSLWGLPAEGGSVAPCRGVVPARLSHGSGRRQGRSVQPLLDLGLWKHGLEQQGSGATGGPPGREHGRLHQEEGLLGRGGCWPLRGDPGQLRGEEGGVGALPRGAATEQEERLSVRGGLSRSRLGGKRGEVGISPLRHIPPLPRLLMSRGFLTSHIGLPNAPQGLGTCSALCPECPSLRALLAHPWLRSSPLTRCFLRKAPPRARPLPAIEAAFSRTAPPPPPAPTP